MNNAVFQPANKPLVSDHIAAEIEKAIVGGLLPPGAKLTLNELAKQFNVSMIPVREALNRLSAQGLITRRPNVGTFVVRLSMREMEDILEVRIPLEGLAARFAAERRSPAEVKALRDAVAQMAKSLLVADFTKYAAMDVKFHHKLWSCARNPFLEKALMTMMNPWFGFQLASGVLARDQDRSIIPVLHGRVVDAIDAGDGAWAERSIAELSTCARSFIQDKLSQEQTD
jgi:DNA-binding GntR family transcriptional regulator